MGTQHLKLSAGSDPRNLHPREYTQRWVPIVARIAKAYKHRLPPSVDVDDLAQSGLLALLQAAATFDGPEVNFEHFAKLRIRSAMLDDLRATDSAPREVRRSMRRIQALTRQLEQKLGRVPTAREMAAASGLSLTAYQRIVHAHRLHQPVYTDDSGRTHHRKLQTEAGSDPLQKALHASANEALQQAVQRLADRERRMFRLYFGDGINLHAIGSMFGVSESRVSQILTKAAAQLRVNFA